MRLPRGAPAAAARSRREVLLGLAAGAGAICARTIPARADDDWSKVVEAARKEGKVVVYSAFVGVPVHDVVKKDLSEKYGITVEFLEARASEVRERIRIEQASGRFAGDLSENGRTTTTLQIMEDHVFQPHGPLPGLARIAPDFQGDNSIHVPISAIVYGILANSDAVTPADEPKSWLDLLDPRWKGKILSDDMRALGGGGVFFSVMEDHFGTEFHTKLAAQQLQFGRELAANERRLARGEFDLYIPEGLNGLPLLEGLPVRFIAPKEGLPYIIFDHAMLQNAPHPNAARVFMNHYLSEDIQQNLVNLGMRSTTTDELTRTDPVVAPFAHSKLLGTTDPKRMDSMLALAKTIYH